MSAVDAGQAMPFSTMSHRRTGLMARIRWRIVFPRLFPAQRARVREGSAVPAAAVTAGSCATCRSATSSATHLSRTFSSIVARAKGSAVDWRSLSRAVRQ
jgi:hypothetical protein